MTAPVVKMDHIEDNSSDSNSIMRVQSSITGINSKGEGIAKANI